MSPGQRRYGEEDQEHYDRPRRRTRPRTKERPTYDDARDGLVLAVDRGRFGLLVDGHAVTAMKARPLGRKAVVHEAGEGGFQAEAPALRGCGQRARACRGQCPSVPCDAGHRALPAAV